MIGFWTICALAASALALVVLVAARGRAAPAPATTAGDELAEIDRLAAQGLLDDAGRTQARAETARRWLAVREDEPVIALRRSDRPWVLGGVGVTALAALGLYAGIGSPGLSDQAYERRVEDWARDPAALEAPQLAAVVARVARESPQDREAWTMLGAARFEAGDPIGAASALRRALALDPDDARSWARLGEAMVRSQDGEIGTDAQAAFRQAIRRDPSQLAARYFLGEAALTRGDAGEVRAMWLPLIEVLDPADPRRLDLEARLPPAPTGEAAS